MRNKASKIFYIILASVLVFFGVCFNSNAAENFAITNFQFDKSGNILLISGNSISTQIKTTTGYLADPARLFVDVQDCVLVGEKKEFKIDQGGIQTLKIAQTSVNPYTVRLVFTAKTNDDFNNIQFLNSKNSITVKFGNINENIPQKVQIYKDKPLKYTILEKVTEQQKNEKHKEAVSNEPITPCEITEIDNSAEPSLDGKAKTLNENISETLDEEVNIVITNIRAIKNHLLVSGVGGISFQESFKLLEPSRVIFDLPYAVIQNKSILKNVVLENGDEIKTGQFDEKTFRIVVTTKQPDKYRVVISPDAQTIAIAHEKDTILTELADFHTISTINNVIVIKKDDDNTHLNFNFSNPIVHSLKRVDDGVFVELINVKQPPAAKLSNLLKTGQFSKIESKPHANYPNGSILYIPLNSGTRMESLMSHDGKALTFKLKEFPIQPKTYSIGRGRKVVIDAGHGGSDPGANRNSIYEKHINLDIVKKVEKYLNAAGVGVIMTRRNDSTLSLKDRVYKSNSNCPDVFVSIHVNSSVKTQIRGVETHWYNANSRSLAKTLHNTFVTGVSSPDRGVFRSMFYVIHHTTAPSVLVEIGFISNPKDLRLLVSERRKDETAKAIANGILMYLTENK